MNARSRRKRKTLAFPVSEELGFLAVQMAEAERDPCGSRKAKRIFCRRMAHELNKLVHRMRREAAAW